MKPNKPAEKSTGTDESGHTLPVSIDDGRGPALNAWRVSRRNVFVAAAVSVAAVGSVGARAFATILPPILPPGLLPPHVSRKTGGGAVKCFLAGTRIATPHGDVDVCELSVGSLVVTATGEVRLIRALGWRRLARQAGGDWNRDDLPVRIARGAIAPAVPSVDVYLSRTHGVLVDGVLIPIGSLVNGTTIAYAAPEGRDDLVYYHLQLSTHDAVVASGLSCETLLPGNGDATNFDHFRSDFGPDELALANVPFAPTQAYRGHADLLASRLRSAALPIADIRLPIDVVRDRLEQRALTV